MNTIELKLSDLTTEKLREMATIVNQDDSEEATIVLGSILGVLETRLSEGDFLAACEEIEAAL